MLQAAHYLRGGTGNEWQYVVEDGVFERALAHDRLRLQELKWHQYDIKVAKTGVRGGARFPKKKEPKDPNAKKTGPKVISIFRKRAGSTSSAEASGSLSSPTSPSDFSLSHFPTRDFEEKSLEQRLYELSIASSTDLEGSIALSDFTAPTFLLADYDEDDLQHSSSEESIASTIGHQRIRSLSLSSEAMDDPLAGPNASPVHSHGNYRSISTGILAFKPEGVQPLDPDGFKGAEMSPGPSALAL